MGKHEESILGLQAFLGVQTPQDCTYLVEMGPFTYLEPLFSASATSTSSKSLIHFKTRTIIPGQHLGDASGLLRFTIELAI
jgi:hypothetical protein